MTLGDFLLGLLMVVGMFLMFVILLQRGRGGGLAGAFGGLGGQSAFGTKAGDVFTVITIVTVVIWVVLACLTGARLNWEENSKYAGHDEPTTAGDTDADDSRKPGEKGAPDKKVSTGKEDESGDKTDADTAEPKANDKGESGAAKSAPDEKPAEKPADDANAGEKKDDDQKEDAKPE